MKSRTENKLVFFEVDHEVSVGKLRPAPRENALERIWKKCGKVKAFSPQPDNTIDLFTDENLFARAVHLAFYKHLPLVLSPDIIWLLIAQGLANHVRQDPEKLRSRFVDFKDKKTLTVVRESASSSWEEVFPAFASEIAKAAGSDLVELVTCDFSTTGAAETIVSQIALMDTVQHYFEYEVMCGCGIPSIALRGTVDDWKRVRAKAGKLSVYGLDWWLKELLPALDHFVAAADGKPDKKFWRAICNFEGMSGSNGDPITGWLQIFFPYLNGSDKQKMRRNTCGLRQYKTSYKSGVTAATYERGDDFDHDTGTGTATPIEDIPPAMSLAPFTYVDEKGETRLMEFRGGITVLVQHQDTHAIEPKVGWAVVEPSTS